VDVVRDVIIPEAARSPFEANAKVFIIEEAERMNAAAQNALLKTLEEPHADTVFILLSDQEDEVLETIRSRCRIVRLERFSEQRVVEVLVQEGATGESALLAARVSELNIERARPLAFETAARERRELWLTIPERLAGPMGAFDAAAEIVMAARENVKLLERAQKSEVAELNEALGDARGSGGARNALGRRHKRELRRAEEEVLDEALQVLASFYRDVIVTRHGGAVVNIDRGDDLERWGHSDVSDAALLAAVERCIATRASLMKNANSALAMDATLLDLGRLVGAPLATSAARQPTQ
jgi:DNA polymerase-3 subunit delta'